MPVHVLQEGFRVFDGVVVPVPDAGKSRGAPRAYPPHAFPWTLCGCHVLDFTVKEVLSHPCSDIQEDFVVVVVARVLIDVFRKLAFLCPPMRRV